MTNRECFKKALKREPFLGRVPHFELAFYLTMETLGKVHPSHRSYSQWNQMSKAEQQLHMEDLSDLYIETARRFHHSAILVSQDPGGVENIRRLLEMIHEKTNGEYSLMLHGDVTPAIPNGSNMMEFAVMMHEQPGLIKQHTEERIVFAVRKAEALAKYGLLDGFALCADYCFNANPFYSAEAFADLVAPYLARIIRHYHDCGYYAIKHTDGNIMPILDQLVQCNPDALHSLDPQGGVDMGEVKCLYGDRVTLIGNVNCGLLQTGTDEECDADVRRSLKQGMEGGTGYIFSTSNCVYTGMPLERYQRMHDIWYSEGIWK